MPESRSSRADFGQIDEQAGTRRMSPAAAPGTAPAIPSTSRAFSAREPCIFQFPATMGRRMGRPVSEKGAAMNDPLPQRR